MKITKEDIKHFVNDFLSLDISRSDREDDKTKALYLYYYLCYKYSTDIINPSNLVKSVGRKQHNGVYRALTKIEDSPKYDKPLYKTLQSLEKSFLHKFEIFEVDETFFVYSRDLLILNRHYQKIQEKLIQAKSKSYYDDFVKLRKQTNYKIEKLNKTIITQRKEKSKLKIRRDFYKRKFDYYKEKYKNISYEKELFNKKLKLRDEKIKQRDLTIERLQDNIKTIHP